MSRKHEQANLLVGLGQLFGPLLKVAENAQGFDTDERTRIVARFCHDRPQYVEQCRQFTDSEPGHKYPSHHVRMYNIIHNIGEGTLNSNAPAEKLRQAIDSARDTLLSIPVPIDSTIHESITPFSTYRLLRDLCSTAKTAIVWIDRYFDSTIFHRFFGDVPSTVLVTLITWPDSKWTSPADKARRNDFKDVSRLFAAERGTGGYRLLFNEAIHARLLRCDEAMFLLGDSIKELGKGPTFAVSRLDSSPENQSKVDDLITTGTECFGPSSTTHC
jgi:hypothetical protein